ncbi:EamA-like transporter family protein [Clavibacter michiganensis subsp. michiganensis]|uniref:EamA-like transporter family protein n=1 Tax=Clavibacter michiganensis subsp. michiganensis TaxID=33013 RepID=A0A251XKY9_CLAMM|nr:EamA-like transporter family protein [Clavibacter michiganensis subsp. michiganensis]OUE03708.1 EamA-like transporter family protein [Clavibacter michiganensis subsp. michiganensis]
MERRHLTTGLVLAIVAACSFGLSGAFVKPLLEAGWSPVAAVALRALVGGLILAPVALVQLRGDLRPVLRAWRRVLGMALVGVAGAQVMYFAAIERIPVGTAILIEFMAPLLLVAVAWAMTRRRPACRCSSDPSRRPAGSRSWCRRRVAGRWIPSASSSRSVRWSAAPATSR